MQVSTVIRNRVSSAGEQPLTLRNGQVVHGKITRLFPGNRAEVQIGSHKLTAEILTPLRAGENYYFQVNQQEGQPIRLQVISEPIRSDAMNSAAQLINHLGIKVTKNAVNYVQQLMNDGISFDKSQLRQAIGLLDRLGYSESNRAVVAEIIARNLPLTESVLRALQSVQSTQLSTLLNNIQQTLLTNPSLTTNEEQVAQLVDRLLNPSTTATNFHPILQSKYTNLLQMLNTHPSSIRQQGVGFSGLFETIERALATLTANEQAIRHHASNILNQFGAMATGSLAENEWQQLRVQLTEILPLLPESMREQIQTLLQRFNPTNQMRLFSLLQTANSSELFTSSKEMRALLLTLGSQQITTTLGGQQALSPSSLISTGENNHHFQQAVELLLMNRTAISTLAMNVQRQFPGIAMGNMTENDWQQVRTLLTEQLLPTLPEGLRGQVEALLQQRPTPTNQMQLHAMMQMLGTNETYNLLEQMSEQATNRVNFSQLPIQNQFLTHLSDTVQTLGLTHEQMISSSFNMSEQIPTELLQSIKSYLLQMRMDAGTLPNDQLTTLLHFVNGLQLQSVQESSHFMFTSFTLPGDKLRLNEDLYMEFEGQKNEDGKLDPDHCRILFVLNLEHLQETIIDMHVQKRVISITVYNDEYKVIEKQTDTLQQMLSSSLEQLDYTLSTVKWKQLHEQLSEKDKVISSKQIDMKQEGFDFKV